MRCIQLMATVGSRTLPVMGDDGKLDSIITIRDVAYAIVARDRELALLNSGDPSVIDIPPRNDEEEPRSHHSKW